MKAELVLLREMKEKHQPMPKMTIDDILEIAEKISEETGHYPSYGDVCLGIYYGRIHPADYLGKRVLNYDQCGIEGSVVE